MPCATIFPTRHRWALSSAFSPKHFRLLSWRMWKSTSGESSLEMLLVAWASFPWVCTSIQRWLQRLIFYGTNETFRARWSQTKKVRSQKHCLVILGTFMSILRSTYKNLSLSLPFWTLRSIFFIMVSSLPKMIWALMKVLHLMTKVNLRPLFETQPPTLVPDLDRYTRYSRTESHPVFISRIWPMTQVYLNLVPKIIEKTQTSITLRLKTLLRCFNTHAKCVKKEIAGSTTR
jgi:hypothetical protein